MKKYITPNMDIRIFMDLTETANPITSSGATPYVTGLESISENNRAQVNMTQMAEITKFIF